jgi:hypothetical protein
MDIEFVNHSSFITRCGDVSLLCDPWIEGTAFNNGWALISPTRFGYEDFARVTHLWFSHEHPDHFAPVNLRKIPEAARGRMRVLFQKTRDRKVVEHCAKLGFAEVRELPFGQWLTLGPGFQVVCGEATNGDSWLAVRAGGRTLLNLNDCAILTPAAARPVRDLVGRVDVLATQFSLSSWEGNPEEIERRRAGARTMLERCVFHAEYFGAEYVIPFASFVWFCHEENFYINAEHNRVDRVVEELRARTRCRPCVLYPGDHWTVGEAFDAGPAIDRHVADFDALSARPRVKAKSHADQDLRDAALHFISDLTQRASRRRLDSGIARAQIKRVLARLVRDFRLADALCLARLLFSLRPLPARIYLWDRDQAYLFDLHGLRATALKRAACEIACGTDSLVYAFRFLWGGESLQVNGRFHEVRPGGRHTLFDYFRLASYFNRGGTLGWRTSAARLTRALRAALRGALTGAAVKEPLAGPSRATDPPVPR